jgi:ribosomal protein L11 methyltransferase
MIIPASDAPYKDLYIYYLEGRIKTDSGSLGSGFIGNWEEEGFSFLFFNSPASDKVKNIISAQSGIRLLDDYRMTYEEWHGKTPSSLSIGRFTITPPWEIRPATKKGLAITLDPGVVFGTGTHTTTHDCMEAIELAFKAADIESVIDLGTGTGLLAIAAAFLGSKKTIAVDINHLAAKTAGQNIILNGMEDRIIAVQGSALDFISLPADLMIANIHYDVMKLIVNQKGFSNKKYFILSGLLKREAQEIDFQLSKLPAKIIKEWEFDGIWHTFFGKIT